MPASAIGTFARALATNSSISELIGFPGRIDDSKVRDEVVRALSRMKSLRCLRRPRPSVAAELIASLPNLETLDIGKDSSWFEKIAEVFLAAREHPNLSTLDVSHLEMESEETAAALAALLRESSTLKELSMRWCDLSTPGFRSLVQGLESNRSLEHLSIQDRQLKPALAKKLQTLARKHPTLAPVD